MGCVRSALVIDDNSDIRNLLGQALALEGYTVHQADNGQTACDLLESGCRPSVMLLDLMMPVMNGTEFLSWVKTHPVHAKTPVVMISASSLAKPPEGTSGYLRKPIDLEEMFNLLKSF
jgi:CheY-like chemotaxis protein